MIIHHLFNRCKSQFNENYNVAHTRTLCNCLYYNNNIEKVPYMTITD